MMIRFDDFIAIKALNEDIDLNDDNISIKIDNAPQDLTDNIVQKFTFIATRRKKMIVLRPKKINGYVQKGEIFAKKTKKRSNIGIVMNNNDSIIGTYASPSFNLAISVNDEVLYDIRLKDCNDNTLVNKMSEEYIKHLKNKKYQVRKMIKQI